MDYKKAFADVLSESWGFLDQHREAVAAQSDDTEIYLRRRIGIDADVILEDDAATINSFGPHQKAAAMKMMDRHVKRALGDQLKGQAVIGHVASAAEAERTRIMDVLDLVLAGIPANDAVHKIYSASFGITNKPAAHGQGIAPALEM